MQQDGASNGDATPVKRRSRGTPVSSEPKLERVVVRPDQPDAPVEMPVQVLEADKPVRKGWWQRRS